MTPYTFCDPCGGGGAGPVVDSQGYRYHKGGLNDGVRAYLAGSGSAPGWGFVIASVQMAAGFVNPHPGIVQVGEAQSAAGYAWSCRQSGQGGTLVVVEYHVLDDTGSYHCPVQLSEPAFGDGHQFTMVYSSQNWRAKKDGTEIWTSSTSAPNGLGFTSGWALAFAETKVDLSNTNKPGLAINFGPATHTTWSYTDDNGSSWQSVENDCPADGCYGDGDADSDGTPDWIIGVPPSPFNINFDPGHFNN